MITSLLERQTPPRIVKSTPEPEGLIPDYFKRCTCRLFILALYADRESVPAAIRLFV
jgi:hypothetical protein